MKPKKINIGLIGFGVVGTGVLKILRSRSRIIQQTSGLDIHVKRVADIDLNRTRGIKLKPGQLIRDARKIIDDPDIHIIVELIGGTTKAFEYIARALKKGKHVVTANKALLAERGSPLFELAKKRRLRIGFEAAVAGGIPIILALRNGLIGNHIRSIYGILNGTANYILTKMEIQGRDFGEVLREAQAKGFAEADPSFDIKGIDAAHKLCLLIKLAYGIFIPMNKIYIKGIKDISQIDIRYARELGYRIKLLAFAKQVQGRLEASVQPVMISKQSLLASVMYEFNSVAVHGDAAGPVLFYGKGAGEQPTGSAVVSDIVEVAKGVASGGPVLETVDEQPLSSLPQRPIKDIRARFYLRIITRDQTGVLARISGILGRNRISIANVVQKEVTPEGNAVVIIITHVASTASLKRAVQGINKLGVVRKKTLAMVIEDDI
jgi:homoserine dehydrogenase